MTHVRNIADNNIVASVVNHYGINTFKALLVDRTRSVGKRGSARHNIYWATDEYISMGPGFMPADEIQLSLITGPRSSVIRPRVTKAIEAQTARTKGKAEVFTPSWLCNRMNNDMDEVFFKYRDAFNTESSDNRSWKPSEEVSFAEAQGTWRQYVSNRMLEITCGEAPFLCSRYDTTTGDILEIPYRIGILDRKLRVITENTSSYDAWWKHAKIALRNVYGYEYQGDSLLIARINVLMTMAEWKQFCWGEWLSEKEVKEVLKIISWNFWQMDGLTDRIPDVADGSRWGIQAQLPGFEEFGIETSEERTPLCKVCDWNHNKEKVTFASIKVEEEGRLL